MLGAWPADGRRRHRKRPLRPGRRRRGPLLSATSTRSSSTASTGSHRPSAAPALPSPPSTNTRAGLTTVKGRPDAHRTHARETTTRSSSPPWRRREDRRRQADHHHSQLPPAQVDDYLARRPTTQISDRLLHKTLTGSCYKALAEKETKLDSDGTQLAFLRSRSPISVITSDLSDHDPSTHRKLCLEPRDSLFPAAHAEIGSEDVVGRKIMHMTEPGGPRPGSSPARHRRRSSEALSRSAVMRGLGRRYHVSLGPATAVRRRGSATRRGCRCRSDGGVLRSSYPSARPAGPPAPRDPHLF